MKSKKPESVLSATIRECFRIWEAMKADGASFQERCAALEKTLRVVWPFTSGYVSFCEDCDGSGLRLIACDGGRTCGRYKRHYPHTFGVPCWCARGPRFMPKSDTSEDFTAATKTAKQPTRFGR